MITFKRGEVINLPLKRTHNRVYLAPEVAQTVVPREIQPGLSLSTITGLLHVKDNLHDIKVLDDAGAADVSSTDDGGSGGGGGVASVKRRKCPPSREDILKKTKYEWGSLDVDLFVKKLMQDGITDIKVETGMTSASTTTTTTITLLGEDTHIQIDDKNTHIVCGGKQSLRLKLRDLLLQCVQKF